MVWTALSKKRMAPFIEVQIKARSNEVTDGDAALFSAITHDLTKNFYFVFYSERLEMMWILSSDEFLQECVTNKTGKMSESIVYGLTAIEQIRKLESKTNTVKNNLKSMLLRTFRDFIKVRYGRNKFETGAERMQ